MIDLSKLRHDDPPKDRQFLAWATEGRQNREARWCVVQWNDAYYAQYWEWSVPGYSTSVEVLGWMELPWNDVYGDYKLEMDRKRKVAP